MPRFDADYVAFRDGDLRPSGRHRVHHRRDDREVGRAGCDITFVLITSGNAGTHDRKYTRRVTLVREREGNGNPHGS